MSPKSEKPSRKQQILEAAASLFAGQGYYKTTTAHVAAAVGVTQPYVFHFFKSKEELYLAVLKQAVDRIHDAFAAVESAPEQLSDTMGLAFERLLADHRNEVLLAMQAYATPEPAVRDFAREQFIRIYRMVRQRFERAGIPNPGAGASLFIGTGLVTSLSETLNLPELLPWKDGC